MIYRFYNHTPIVLVGTPEAWNDIGHRNEACRKAAAAIFTTLFNECDPRIYNYLKIMIEEANRAESVSAYAKGIAQLAQPLKIDEA